MAVSDPKTYKMVPTPQQMITMKPMIKAFLMVYGSIYKNLVDLMVSIDKLDFTLYYKDINKYNDTIIAKLLKEDTTDAIKLNGIDHSDQFS